MSMPILKGEITGKSLTDLYEQAYSIAELFYGRDEVIEVRLSNTRADVECIDESTLGGELSLGTSVPKFHATFEAHPYQDLQHEECSCGQKKIW